MKVLQKLGFCGGLLMMLCANVFAFPPLLNYDLMYLLSDYGEMQGSFENPHRKEDDPFADIYFDGEVEITGVLARVYNEDSEGYESELRFHPDKNLALPFASSSMGKICKDKDTKNTENAEDESDTECVVIGNWLGFDSPLISSVRLDGYALPESLPKALKEPAISEVAMRAKVKLRDYHFYSEGEAGREAWAELVEVKPLSEVAYADLAYSDDGKKVVISRTYISSKYDIYAEYGSKDSFINLRDKPKGKIIAQIQRKDMQGDAPKARIMMAPFECECNLRKVMKEQQKEGKKWFEVFYLPPDFAKPQDAIYGYIHASQLKIGDE